MTTIQPEAARIMVVCCPQLCGPADARATAQMFERVLAAVTLICPGVEAVEPGVCAFGARGPGTSAARPRWPAG